MMLATFTLHAKVPVQSTVHHRDGIVVIHRSTVNTSRSLQNRGNSKVSGKSPDLNCSKSSVANPCGL